jgi:hypothetical protein
MTSPDQIITDLHAQKRQAILRAARTKARSLIESLHDLDGSRMGGGFNSSSLGKARDLVEAAVAEIER